MAKTPCVGGVQWSTEMACHDMKQEAGGWACSRCGHMADNARVRTAAVTRCPVACFRFGGARSNAAEWWMRGLVGLLGLYGRAAEESDVLEETDQAAGSPPASQGVGMREHVVHQGAPEVRAAASQRAPFLAAYATHRLVGAAGCTFCLRCGETPRDNRRVREMLSQPCPRLVPVQEMPVRMKVMVRELGPELVQPLERPLRATERTRIGELARHGERLAGRRASWERLLARGGECLV